MRSRTIVHSRTSTTQNEPQQPAYVVIPPSEETRRVQPQRNLPKCNYSGAVGSKSSDNSSDKKSMTEKQQKVSKATEKQNHEIAKMKRLERRKNNLKEMKENEREEKLNEDRKLKMDSFLSRFKQAPTQSDP